MPSKKAYCLLCGVPISRPRPGTHSPHDPLWTKFFRAVYTEQYLYQLARLSRTSGGHPREYYIPLDGSIQTDITDFSVPGFGFDNVVSLELNRTSFGNVDGSGDPRSVMNSGDPIWGYPLHCGCWDILSSTYSAFRPGREVDVQALFDLCRSQPIPSGLMFWGHDYGGLVEIKGERRRESFEDYVLHSLGLGLCPSPRHGDVFNNAYLQDPYNIPELAGIFRLSSQEPTKEAPNDDRSTIARTGSTIDPLAVLPTEILATVFMLLNSRDVRNLCLASRCAASLELPAQFWRSRFMGEHEFSWAFEANLYPVSAKPWKTLYLRTRAILDVHGVQNRKRIWNLAQVLCRRVDLRLANDTCYGTPCPSGMEAGGVSDAFDWSTRESPANKPTYFEWGSRALFNRKVEVPQAPFQIFVSSVRIEQTTYISGIRLVKVSQPPVILGYPRLESEEEVIWESSQQAGSALVGFYVALDMSGICGLAVLSTGGELSSWAGQPNRACKGRLSARAPGGRAKPLTYLKGGFDALKLVSLSVTDGTPDSGLRENRRPIRPARDVAYWSPEVPDKHLTLVAGRMGNFDGIPLRPMHVSMFGGAHGEHLPYLGGFTVWTREHQSERPKSDLLTLIHGIQFHYSQEIGGQSSIVLGEIPKPFDPQHGRPAKVESFHVELDSIHGERLTKIVSYTMPGQWSDRSPCQFGFNFHTNRDRVVEIPPSSNSYLVEKQIVYGRGKRDKGLIVGVFAWLDPVRGIENFGVAMDRSLSREFQATEGSSMETVRRPGLDLY